MPIDFQEEETPAAASSAGAGIDFQSEPDYMARIGPAMRQVMGEWNVNLAKPGEGLSQADADTLNRTLAFKVRKEAEKRLAEGSLRKVARGTQQAAVSLAESMRDPQTLGLIALSAVAPEVGLPIFAGIGAQQAGQTGGTLSVPGATTTEEKTKELLTAGLMALPAAAAPIKAVRNYRGAVADLAEETAMTGALTRNAQREALRLSFPQDRPIDFVEEKPTVQPAYQFPPEAAFFETRPPAYAAKPLPEMLGGIFRSPEGAIGKLTRTPDGRYALDDGQQLLELRGGPDQTVGELGLRAVSLGQAGPLVGQYPAEPMPILSRLQTSRNAAAFRKLNQAAQETLTEPAPDLAAAKEAPMPGLEPAHVALIDAVAKTAEAKDPPLEQLYGALEAAPTARRVLEGTIRQMEQRGAKKEQTDPLYKQLGTIESFENSYLDSSGTQRLEPPSPAGLSGPASPARADVAGPALQSEKGKPNATQEGQQSSNVPVQSQNGDRGGPAAEAGAGDSVQSTATQPGTEADALASAPIEATTVFDPSRIPVTEVPLKDIYQSEDVPNFKGQADPATGVVPGQELSGKYERLPLVPITLWRRLSKRLEVITGRHRLHLARSSGEETISAQIVDEARGFTKEMALTFDAVANIRDGQGSVEDYAHYFRNSPQITEAAAGARGLLGRAKGRAGFDLGKHAADDLYSLWQSGKITEAQALAATRAAPDNPAGQRIGARYALQGQSPDFIANLVKLAMAESKGLAKNLDLFGEDDPGMRAMEEQAKRAAKFQASLREQISAVSGAVKKPEVARKMGVNIEDPEAVRAKVVELRTQLTRWESWPAHPDLVALTKGETPPASGATVPSARTEAATLEETPKLRPGEKGTGDLFQSEDAPFNLAGETAPDPERLAREQAAAEAAKAEAAAVAAGQQPALPGTVTNPLIDKIRALIDPATGNLTRGGDVVRQLIADHSTDQITEFVRWARGSPQSTPYISRFGLGAAVDVLRERGVPVDSVEWQQATLGPKDTPETGAGRVAASSTGTSEAPSSAASSPRAPTARPLRSLPKSVGVPAAVSGPAPATGPIANWFAQRLRGFRAVFAPASIDRGAAYVAGVMREMIGRSANALSQADEAMKSWRREFDRTPVPANYVHSLNAPLPHNYAVIDALERNRAALPARYQALADIFDKEFAWRIAEIQKFAPNALQHLYENYFPHIWQDDKRAAGVMAQMATRLFAGRKEFLKQRSLPLFVEGLERGLKPISDNPVDLLLGKMHSMDKMITALRAIDDFKQTGHYKFNYIFEPTPESWTAMDDPAFTVYKPPYVTVKEAFDAQLRTRTYELLQKLGVPHSRLATLGGKRWGLAYESPEQIKTRFAAPESVTWHELGHVLDFRYNLQKDFLHQGGPFNNQVRALADARDPSAGPGRQKYLRKAEEKMAVLLEAYVHAPEVFKSIAPDVFAKFDRFIEDHPELHDIRRLKPSLELAVGQTDVHAGGPILLGHWIMPEGAAQVIRNYLSPGLASSGLYRTFRGASNLLNAAQLGLSGFHAGFTTLDVAFTSAEAGLYQLLRGQLGAAARSAGRLPLAPILNYYSGKAIQSAMIRPQATHIPVAFGLGKLPVTSVARDYAELAVKAGLRATIDPFWQTHMTRNLARAAHAGGLAWLKTPLYLPLALVEQSMRPLTEFLVPRQKLGVFAMLAKSELERAGFNAPPEQTRAALARAANSTEDRMGQMTYDIQFQHRIAKDLAMIAFRAYGWQLGKYRALLGATTDTATAIKELASGRRPDVTHRMTYAVALPLGVATIGGVLNYLLSGKPPQTAMDYFHPKTGELDRNGHDQRLSLPTYLKDLESDATGLRRGWQAGGPLGALRGIWDATYHRMNPWVSEAVDMLNNKDFYGTQIYNPDDPLLSKLADQARFIAKGSLPFAVTGSQRLAEEDASMAKRLLPFVGIVPAKAELTMTPAELRAAEIIQASQPVGAHTAEQFEKSKQAKELIRELKTDPLKGREALRDAFATRQVSPEEAGRIFQKTTMTPLQYQVWKMSADDAMRVWDLANREERAQIGALIHLKLLRAREMPLDTRRHYAEQLQKPAP